MIPIPLVTSFNIKKYIYSLDTKLIVSTTTSEKVILTVIRYSIIIKELMGKFKFVGEP